MIRLPRPLTAAAALLAAVALATCSDAPVATGAGPARLAFAPTFSPRALQAAAELDAVGISIASVKVVIARKATGEVLAEHLVPVEAGASSVTLEAEVHLRASEEELKAKLHFRDPEGTVLFAGEQVIVARAGSSTPAEIAATVIEYVGPGAKAVALHLAPADTSISTLAPIALTAVATDAAGAVVTSPLLIWSSGDASLATVDGAGLVTPLGPRGVVQVTARVPSGVSATATVRLVPPAAAISRVGTATLGGPAGSAVLEPFRVRVLAADSLPVAGEPVAFAAATPGGFVADATVATDSAGYAATTVSLGQVAGSYEFRASVNGLPAVAVTATATPAAATRIAVASGDAQSALVGTVLEPLAVQVADDYGNVVAGATVAWRRASGTGTLAATTSITDASGVARVSYTLGTTAGAESVVAALPDAPTAEAQFALTALPLPAAGLSLLLAPGDTVRSGIPFASAVRVQLVDSTGAAVAQAGTGVTASARRIGEMIAPFSFTGPLTVQTDAAGVAEFTGLTLAGLVGPFILSFTSEAGGGVDSDTLELIEGNVATIELQPAVPALPVTVMLDSVIADQLWLVTRDSAGNVVPATPVAYSVTDTATGGVVLDTVLASNAIGEIGADLFPIPAVAGGYRVTMSVGTPAVSSTGFTLVVTAPTAPVLAPAAIVHGAATALEAGDRQVPVVGTPLALPLLVQLRDSTGAGVATSGIAWSRWDDTVWVALDTTVTDSTGIASHLPVLPATDSARGYVFEARALEAPQLALRFQAVARPDATWDRVWFGVPGDGVVSPGASGWSDAASWDAGVPLGTSNVLVPEWGAFATSPLLTQDVAIGSYRGTTATYGFLDLGGFALTIGGNVDARLVQGTGTVRLAGTAASATLTAVDAAVEIPQGAAVTIASMLQARSLDVFGSLTAPDGTAANLNGGDFNVWNGGILDLAGSGSIVNARSVLLDDGTRGITASGQIGFTRSFVQRATSGIPLGGTFSLVATLGLDSATVTVPAGAEVGTLILSGAADRPTPVLFTAPLRVSGALQAVGATVTADSIGISGQVYGDSASSFAGVRVVATDGTEPPIFEGPAPALVTVSGDVTLYRPATYNDLDILGTLALSLEGRRLTANGRLRVLGPAAALRMSLASDTVIVRDSAVFAGRPSDQDLVQGTLIVQGDLLQRNFTPDQFTNDAFRPGGELEVVFGGTAARPQRVAFEAAGSPTGEGSFLTRARVEPEALVEQRSTVRATNRLQVRGRWTAVDFNAPEPLQLLDVTGGALLQVEGVLEASALNVYTGTTVEVIAPGSVTTRSCYDEGAQLVGIASLGCQYAQPLLGTVTAVLGSGVTGPAFYAAVTASAELRPRG